MAKGPLLLGTRMVVTLYQLADAICSSIITRGLYSLQLFKIAGCIRGRLLLIMAPTSYLTLGCHMASGISPIHTPRSKGNILQAAKLNACRLLVVWDHVNYMDPGLSRKHLNT